MLHAGVKPQSLATVVSKADHASECMQRSGKEDYTIAKAWRPISLLVTLGKGLESAVAERMSHMVETHGLLIGARKQRSVEQALVLLQEQIYIAMRGRRTVSLISFDVKGAYNGVCKERLLQRMKVRGIPERLLRWVEAFCSQRTASIYVNGQAFEIRELPQAGLLQGSPLSLILFLFFNTDLVQQRIVMYGSAISIQNDEIRSFSTTLGKREEQSPYSAELAAMTEALNRLLKLRFRNIVLTTRNKAGVLTLRRSGQQSGQSYIIQLYKAVQTLRRDGNTMTALWLPAGEAYELARLAKQEAKTSMATGRLDAN